MAGNIATILKFLKREARTLVALYVPEARPYLVHTTRLQILKLAFPGFTKSVISCKGSSTIK